MSIEEIIELEIWRHLDMLVEDDKDGRKIEFASKMITKRLSALQESGRLVELLSDYRAMLKRK